MSMGSLRRAGMLLMKATWSYTIHLIVGLNVATKGAQPFSRGKRVVPHHTKISMQSQTLELHYTTK